MSTSMIGPLLDTSLSKKRQTIPVEPSPDKIVRLNSGKEPGEVIYTPSSTTWHYIPFENASATEIAKFCKTNKNAYRYVWWIKTPARTKEGYTTPIGFFRVKDSYIYDSPPGFKYRLISLANSRFMDWPKMVMPPAYKFRKEDTLKKRIDFLKDHFKNEFDVLPTEVTVGKRKAPTQDYEPRLVENVICARRRRKEANKQKSANKPSTSTKIPTIRKKKKITVSSLKKFINDFENCAPIVRFDSENVFEKSENRSNYIRDLVKSIGGLPNITTQETVEDVSLKNIKNGYTLRQLLGKLSIPNASALYNSADLKCDKTVNNNRKSIGYVRIEPLTTLDFIHFDVKKSTYSLDGGPVEQKSTPDILDTFNVSPVDTPPLPNTEIMEKFVKAPVSDVMDTVEPSTSINNNYISDDNDDDDDNSDYKKDLVDTDEDESDEDEDEDDDDDESDEDDDESDEEIEIVEPKSKKVVGKTIIKLASKKRSRSVSEKENGDESMDYTLVVYNRRDRIIARRKINPKMFVEIMESTYVDE